jgi:hypothetical protein
MTMLVASSVEESRKTTDNPCEAEIPDSTITTETGEHEWPMKSGWMWTG